MHDRFGIGWRPELAAGILSNLDRIDIVEMIADDYFDAPRSGRRALKTLARQVPLALHGVTLGLASSAPVAVPRLEQTARLVEEIQPEFWSEHLAFVRGAGVEIGHLAAPPRTAATIEGAARNLAAARTIVGTFPLVENVATLIDPPASTLSEPAWTSEILAAANCSLLLDLHNLYANSVNFGFDPYGFIDRIPQKQIRAIHLAGGRWIKAITTDERRLLDDHLHDVPEAVYDLIKYIGIKTSHPLTVILERDGRYPPIDGLLNNSIGLAPLCGSGVRSKLERYQRQHERTEVRSFPGETLRRRPGARALCRGPAPRSLERRINGGRLRGAGKDRSYRPRTCRS